jgi:hypothetical protein
MKHAELYHLKVFEHVATALKAAEIEWGRLLAHRKGRAQEGWEKFG